MDDVPVILQDKKFDDEGHLDDDAALLSPVGQLGDQVLVNGTAEPYMFHCHLLRHEDRGMMGQFVVVKPGQRAGTPAQVHEQVHGR